MRTKMHCAILLLASIGGGIVYGAQKLTVVGQTVADMLGVPRDQQISEIQKKQNERFRMLQKLIESGILLEFVQIDKQDMEDIKEDAIKMREIIKNIKNLKDEENQGIVIKSVKDIINQEIKKIENFRYKIIAKLMPDFDQVAHIEVTKVNKQKFPGLLEKTISKINTVLNAVEPSAREYEEIIELLQEYVQQNPENQDAKDFLEFIQINRDIAVEAEAKMPRADRKREVETQVGPGLRQTTDVGTKTDPARLLKKARTM